MSRFPSMQRTGIPPSWATEWGQDEYGVFVAFAVGGATQRLRWIPPGTFVMGSPEGEAGRDSGEGPQHEVTLTRGFWLGETPVTQALWQAVMGSNPSRFVDPERPVERVSWNEAQTFLGTISPHLAGSKPQLPNEPEWEYACRAGTSWATWKGDLVIHGLSNAPVLDAIAWYSGNCGLGFELQDGEEPSGWRGKQYEYAKAGSRRVGLKVPNPWGLYDMLGNVWEWCEGDARRTPRSDLHPSVFERKAIRGGAWSSRARSVRAASRLDNFPTERYDNLGFRLALQPLEP